MLFSCSLIDDACDIILDCRFLPESRDTPARGLAQTPRRRFPAEGGPNRGGRLCFRAASVRLRLRFLRAHPPPRAIAPSPAQPAPFGLIVVPSAPFAPLLALCASSTGFPRIRSRRTWVNADTSFLSPSHWGAQLPAPPEFLCSSVTAGRLANAHALGPCKSLSQSLLDSVVFYAL